MNDEEYRLLARIERGDSVFRPAGPAGEERAAFQQTVAQLLQLRQRGWIRLPEGRIGRSKDGSYIVVGPCDLTPDGIEALRQDRRLGPRPGM
jgi:hypothetical protein